MMEEYSSTSSIPPKFSAHKFAFISITRTFHEWQNKEKRKEFGNGLVKLFSKEHPDFFEHNLKKCLPVELQLLK